MFIFLSAFGVVIYLLSTNLNALKRDFNFMKIDFRSRPTVIAVHNDIQDVMVCAKACSSATEHSGCTAFQIMEERCYLFTGTIEDTDKNMGTESEIAFKVLGGKEEMLPCTSHNGFQLVTMADNSYCLLHVAKSMSFNEAREYCHSRQAFLAFVATIEKSDSVASAFNIKHYLINAKFDPVSTTYKGDRPGDVITLDNEMWFPETNADYNTTLLWREKFPCVIVDLKMGPVGKLLKMKCTSLNENFFCERFDFTV